MSRPHPAPNVPECTCDRDDDSWVGEAGPMPLCPYHEKRLRHLSWESLACMVIDYEAALRADGEPVGATPESITLSGSALEAVLVIARKRGLTVGQVTAESIAFGKAINNAIECGGVVLIHRDGRPAEKLVLAS